MGPGVVKPGHGGCSIRRFACITNLKGLTGFEISTGKMATENETCGALRCVRQGSRLRFSSALPETCVGVQGEVQEARHQER